MAMMMLAQVLGLRVAMYALLVVVVGVVLVLAVMALFGSWRRQLRPRGERGGEQDETLDAWRAAGERMKVEPEEEDIEDEDESGRNGRS
ncbi:MAG: hypothetical protein RLN76_04575 [Phycisphaeraceae bacterium]